jgi:tRNA threonylcarbamoyladenosine biosynthesis protein TsaE
VVRLVKLISKSQEQTFEIGQRIGRALVPGDVVALSGVLGSGKSVVARGILEALGAGSEIPSPSFVIVATYEGEINVNHIDLYRLGTVEEALEIGIEDLLCSDAVSVVEWAEKIRKLLPSSRIDFLLEPRKDPDQRLLTIRPNDEDMGERLAPLVMSLLHGGGHEGFGD